VHPNEGAQTSCPATTSGTSIIADVVDDIAPFYSIYLAGLFPKAIFLNHNSHET